MPALQPRRDESRRFGLFRFRSPLLTESLLLSLPPGSEMFQFPGFATYAYGFSVRQFGYPGINTRLTIPPGLSQSSTPFIASWRQDIPHMPLVAWPHRSHPPARVDTAGEWITALTTETRVPRRARVKSNDPFLSQAHAEILTYSEKHVLKP